MSQTCQTVITVHKNQSYQLKKVEAKLKADLKKHGILIKSDRQSFSDLRKKP